MFFESQGLGRLYRRDNPKGDLLFFSSLCVDLQVGGKREQDSMRMEVGGLDTQE